jgi:hypothetical protein
LLRRGRTLEGITLGWNIAGIIVLAIAAVRARSVALAGFGLDSMIEIGASTVVLWELSGTGEDRQRRALRLIGGSCRSPAGRSCARGCASFSWAPWPSRSPSAWAASSATTAG